VKDDRAPASEDHVCTSFLFQQTLKLSRGQIQCKAEITLSLGRDVVCANQVPGRHPVSPALVPVGWAKMTGSVRHSAKLLKCSWSHLSLAPLLRETLAHCSRPLMAASSS
jgi:hypothetical protein